MNWSEAVVISVLINAVYCAYDPTFPAHFQFGVSSSAYQIEGGWNASDKSENIWDRLVHTSPDRIGDGSSGDVSCDSYHLWRRDVEMLNELGVDFYRFSISWPRLLPNGFTNYISEDGMMYYSDLIDSLLELGIEPMVTLFHYDLPQIIQDLGGWTNPLITDWFADYARVVFTLFGDRVKTFLTINEPMAFCDAGYTGLAAPNMEDPDIAMYLCNKYMIIAHAKAWRAYHEEFRSKFNGKVSYTNLFFWFEPLTVDDTELADLAIQFWEGRYAHPVFSKEGGWPPAIEQVIATNSKAKGYSFSRLPAFTEVEKKLVQGTYDFYALNHYSTFKIRKAKPGEAIPPYPFEGIPELNAVMVPDPNREYGGAPWCMVYPEGLRHQLQYMKRQYGDIEIKITENGYPSTDAHIDDHKRVEFLRGMMEQLLISIQDDNVNVTAYSVWSLMDSFEWAAGYLLKFGLYNVNFTDPERTRTPRLSAQFYAEVIKRHSLANTSA